MNQITTESHPFIFDLIENPHKLGRLVGKTKLTSLHSYWIKFCWYPFSYFEKNDNLKKMLDFFNDMGKTIDIQINDKVIEREFLTEEQLLSLLKNEKRSLKGHRGSFKTTAIVEIGCIIRLLFDPEIRIAIIRKDFTKASEILKTISNMMKVPEVKEIFNSVYDIQPKAIKDADNVWSFNLKNNITPEGNINAYGVHQDMIGKHFDLIICDDFITLEDKISKAEREKTKIHLEEITNNILDPGKQIMYLGTVWHKDDAWILCPNALIFDWRITKILSAEEIEKKRQGTTTVTFAANYELRHSPAEDQMFKDANYMKWDFHYKTGVFGHLDAKYSGTDTNALTFMVRKKDRRIQAIGFTFNEHIEDKFNFIYEKWKKYFCGTIFNEDNADKGFVAKELIKLGIPVQLYHESQNKHVKIENFLYKNWNIIDWCTETDPNYINQILDYQEGQSPDDCCDGAASLIREKFDINSVNMKRWQL